jgi:hypothetical protein
LGRGGEGGMRGRWGLLLALLLICHRAWRMMMVMVMGMRRGAALAAVVAASVCRGKRRR